MPTGDVSPTIEYESFLLRLRRTNGPDAGSCRIYLQDAHTGKGHYFNSLRELMVYLGQSNDAREEGPPPFATGEG